MKLEPGDEIAWPEALDRARLDLSLESLHVVDRWLELLHRRRDELERQSWIRSVLRGGAYVGEVIRNNAKRRYDWVDYDQYMPRHPDLRRLIPERTTATCAFLCTDTDVMTMPLNKIVRFIEEGPENNIHYYASVECQQE